MGNVICVNDLTKSYGTTLAVDHVLFDVQEGEIFGFLGPNGAGKTTTIRMMVGLTQPSSGTALIGGHDILKEPVKVFYFYVAAAGMLMPSCIAFQPMHRLCHNVPYIYRGR